MAKRLLKPDFLVFKALVVGRACVAAAAARLLIMGLGFMVFSQ